MDDVTPSTLLYLFADRVIEADRALTAGTEVPCSDAKVRRKDLVATVFAWALHGLAEQGRAEIEHRTRKRLKLITTTDVIVSPTATTAETASAPPAAEGGGTASDPDGGDPQGEAVASVEERLAAALAAAGEPVPAYRLVRDWYGEDVGDPYGHAISALREVAASRGFFDTVDLGRGRVAGLLLGNTTLEPRCADIAAAADRFAGAHAAWEAFAADAPETASLLISRCGRAVASRREASDGDD